MQAEVFGNEGAVLSAIYMIETETDKDKRREKDKEKVSVAKH